MSDSGKPEKKPGMVESVAKAIYFSQVERARQEIDKVDFDLSDFPEIFRRLNQEGETAQVLIFGSYLEDRITGIIRTKMKHLSSKEDENSLFGPHGPLSSLSARVLLSYQLGWISTDTKNKLDAFRKIRNHFAHKAYQARITDPEIAKFLLKIDYNPARMLEVIAEAVGSDGNVAVIAQDDLTPEKRYLCNFAYLAEHVFSELLLFPIAIAYNVDPRSLRGGYDQSPKAIQQLYRLLSMALMSIIVKPQIASPRPVGAED
jgi:DNA-binding MltR family transcriptional regulator